jgi:hypothetical protein
MIVMVRRLVRLAVRSGLAATLVAACSAAVMHAQTTPPRPVTPPVVIDTTKKPVVLDSARQRIDQVRSLPPAIDTTKKKPANRDSIAPLTRDQALVTWDPPDSTMQELGTRPNYKKVEYQGDKVRFDSKTGLLHLVGVPAAVQRDETLLVGDTIVYNDSAQTILALGDTVKLRDNSQKDGQDVVAHGKINYDLATRSGAIGAFETSVESGGQRLYLEAKGGNIYADSTVGGKHIVYARDGSFTYCDLAEPHFHFATKEMKFVSDNIMVARPGVLYIGEVPVFWIPFFFQDVRSGRRSGLLTPSFGIAELLRNSPSYRRQLNNLGYFFALNDYMDAELSIDWRSDANGTFSDRGFVRTNGEWRYRWINRFITGRVALERLVYANGNTNLSISINHSQDFSRLTRLTANLNWTQNTRIQQATTINPYAATATILSQLNYQTKIGPASLQIGGTRRQYPGRTQTETDFPSLTVSTGPQSLGPVTWTPSGRLAISSKSGIDQGLQYPFSYKPRLGGGVDSTLINAGSRMLNAGFESPIKIFDFQLANSFTLSDQVNNYPQDVKIQNVRIPSDTVRRVYSQYFLSSFDYIFSFNLPRFLTGTWNVSPTINFNNVDASGGLFVRSTLSGGNWVGQSKRPTYGLSTSPTLFAQFPGFGPIARFRHSISPSITYSYAPQGNVSDAYLAATNHSRIGYLGAQASNRIGLGLATNLEAKLRATNDSMPDSQARKIKIIAMNFSALSWDFIRADTVSKLGCKTLCGLSETNFSISATSDLVPGLDFHTNYSLFQGDPVSDTAVFKPFRTDVGATFSLTGKSAILAAIGKLFGARGGSLDDAVMGTDHTSNVADDVMAAQKQQMSAAGRDRRSTQLTIPEGRGWSLNLNYTTARQRPPVGGTVIANDPTALCAGLKFVGNDVPYQNCLNQALINPPTSNNNNIINRSVTFLSPPTQTVASNLTFNVTKNWAAQWSTSYDIERARFATQQVGLQRTLHDWMTTFSFNQSPNGAFSFNFFISLKAAPAVKFNYDRASYRSAGS